MKLLEIHSWNIKTWFTKLYHRNPHSFLSIRSVLFHSLWPPHYSSHSLSSPSRCLKIEEDGIFVLIIDLEKEKQTGVKLLVGIMKSRLQGCFFHPSLLTYYLFIYFFCFWLTLIDLGIMTSNYLLSKSLYIGIRGPSSGSVLQKSGWGAKRERGD